jgi:hypothetical protein
MTFKSNMDMRISEYRGLSDRELTHELEELYEYLYRLGKNYNDLFNIKINPLLMHESVRILTLNGNLNQETQNKIIQIQMDYFSPADFPFQQIIVNESYQDIDFAFKRFLMKLKDHDNEVFKRFFNKTIDYYLVLSMLNGDFSKKNIDYINDLFENLSY